MQNSKVNLLQLKIGDPVIHKATGMCGTVEVVEFYGTTQGQMLTVAMLNGRRMRGISRDEFGLHTPGAAQVKAQTAPQWAVPTPENPQPITVNQTVNVWHNMGPASDKSLLDEIC